MTVIKYVLPTLVTLTLCITASTTAQSSDKKHSEAKPPPTEIRIDRSAGWPRPRSDERKPERRFMVDRQLAARDSTDKTVLDFELESRRGYLTWLLKYRLRYRGYHCGHS